VIKQNDTRPNSEKVKRTDATKCAEEIPLQQEFNSCLQNIR